MDDERWSPVPLSLEFQLAYEVSDHGRVHSLRRNLILKPSFSNTGGYPLVILTVNYRRIGAYVHHLVLGAFQGPAPSGTECRHLDGDPRNCRLDNLAWGTSGENKRDEVRHGTHYEARRSHCDAGHEFNETNSYWNGRQRVCRPCRNARVKAWYERNRKDARCE